MVQYHLIKLGFRGLRDSGCKSPLIWARQTLHKQRGNAPLFIWSFYEQTSHKWRENTKPSTMLGPWQKIYRFSCIRIWYQLIKLGFSSDFNLFALVDVHPHSRKLRVGRPNFFIKISNSSFEGDHFFEGVLRSSPGSPHFPLITQWCPLSPPSYHPIRTNAASHTSTIYPCHLPQSAAPDLLLFPFTYLNCSSYPDSMYYFLSETRTVARIRTASIV